MGKIVWLLAETEKKSLYCFILPFSEIRVSADYSLISEAGPHVSVLAWLGSLGCQGSRFPGMMSGNEDGCSKQTIELHISKDFFSFNIL